MNANIATPVSFSLDRAISFARDAVLGHAAAKASNVGLSEQLWAGLRDVRSVKFADDFRDSFDSWVDAERDATGEGCKTRRQVAERVAGWKKGSPLSTRLSECRRIVAGVEKITDEQRAQVWACDSLSAALKVLRGFAPKEPTKVAEPSVVLDAPCIVEANADEGESILADMAAWLDAADDGAKWDILAKLDALVSSHMGK